MVQLAWRRHTIVLAGALPQLHILLSTSCMVPWRWGGTHSYSELRCCDPNNSPHASRCYYCTRASSLCQPPVRSSRWLLRKNSLRHSEPWTWESLGLEVDTSSTLRHAFIHTWWIELQNPADPNHYKFIKNNHNLIYVYLNYSPS
jgi:hypothetical protein